MLLITCHWGLKDMDETHLFTLLPGICVQTVSVGAMLESRPGVGEIFSTCLVLFSLGNLRSCGAGVVVIR